MKSTRKRLAARAVSAMALSTAIVAVGTAARAQNTTFGPGIAAVSERFTVGPDRTVWYKNGYNGSWHSLGQTVTSEPDILRWRGNRLDVVARGPDGSVWYTYATDMTANNYQGNWSKWDSMGGWIQGKPTICSGGPDDVQIFARGLDNALWRRSYNNGWGAWQWVGGFLTSAPDCVATADSYHVVMRGGQGDLWHASLSRVVPNASWAWESLGGRLASGPTIASWGPGRLDVFGVGIDEDLPLFHRAFDTKLGGYWREWERLGGTVTSPPDAVGWSDGWSSGVSVVGQGSDSNIWEIDWRQTPSEGSWSGWYKVGSPVAQSVSAPPTAPSCQMSSCTTPSMPAMGNIVASITIDTTATATCDDMPFAFGPTKEITTRTEKFSGKKTSISGNLGKCTYIGTFFNVPAGSQNVRVPMYNACQTVTVSNGGSVTAPPLVPQVCK